MRKLNAEEREILERAAELLDAADEFNSVELKGSGIVITSGDEELALNAGAGDDDDDDEEDEGEDDVPEIPSIEET